MERLHKLGLTQRHSLSLLSGYQILDSTLVMSLPAQMLNVKTAWSGPDGTAITSATRVEMKSFTLYVSS